MANHFKPKEKKQSNMSSTEKEKKQEEELASKTSNNSEVEDTSSMQEEKSLEMQLEEASTKVDELQDKYLRLSAEFDNYRKRTMKEKAELIMNGGAKVITSILPVLDDLERAIKMMENSSDIKAMKEGIDLIYAKFINILSQNGLTKIETEKQDFNTDFHEAIATIPAPSEELKGKILDCVQTGYTLNDKVIRHAKVVVGE